MNTIDRDDIHLETCPLKHKLAITQFTMGDLHANAIKLLYMLVRNGVCHLSSQHYQSFVDVYKSPLLTQETRKQFDELVDKHLAVINRSILVRFLGDSLADRGRNDWFVLKILGKLTQEGVCIKTILSNHDAIFLNAIGLNGRDTESEVPLIADSNGSLGRSYLALYQSIVNGTVSKTEVDTLIKTAYLPTLVLIDYSLNEDYLTIFSHAPVDFISIKNLANQFNVSYMDASPGKLVNTINAINRAFQNAIEQDNIPEMLAPGTAVYDTIWMREKTLYESRGNQETRNVSGIRFIYGHDKWFAEDSMPANIFRLDNMVGKGNMDSCGEKNIAWVSDDPFQY